jgi:Domain of unknown function (DUF427)
MPNAAPGFVSRPDHRVHLLPDRRRVKVVFGDMTVADSGAALRVEETGHGPVYYIPEQDVRLDLMHPTEHHTRCPYKGEASYLDDRGSRGGRLHTSVRERRMGLSLTLRRSLGPRRLLCVLPEPGRFDRRYMSSGPICI